MERVVIGFPSAATPETVAILRSLQGRVKMALVPRYFELISWRSTLTDLYGLPLLEVAAPHISQWDRFIKRSLDIARCRIGPDGAGSGHARARRGVRATSPGPHVVPAGPGGSRQETLHHLQVPHDDH